MATILVVDDSSVIRHLLSYTLRREGHTVFSASSGFEALDLLGSTPVDLVIADMVMPEMDGLALLDAIRDREGLHGLRLIMITASGQEHDRMKAEAAGVYGFLTKPVGSRELLAAVERVLAPDPQHQTKEGEQQCTVS